MSSAPMEEPNRMSCQERRLHWDRIGMLWVCDACGASLSYDAWNTGSLLECRSDGLPRQRSMAGFRPLYWRKRPYPKNG